jgi:apolipoprotein N-acyltransferase
VQKTESSQWLRVALGILLAGTAYYFGTGLDAIGALVWVAPLPVLIPAFTLGAGQTAVLSLGASLLGGLNMVPYLAAIVPKPVVAAALLIPAIAYAGSILLARRAARILPPTLSVLPFPVAWTSYEYLLSVVSPHGTAGSLAYTQTWLPLIQLASITGVWGITSVITLVPAGIAVAWHRRTPAPLAIPLAFAAAALLFGWGRLAIPNDRPIIRVGLTATDETVSCFGTNRSDQALPVIGAYARRVGQLASRGAQVVLLPEKFVGIAPAYAADATGILGTAASSGKVTVIAGLNEVGVRPMRNTAVVFSPDGHILASYDKIHLLPGPETGYLAGKDIALFSLCGATAGVAICKDMDFPGLGRRYSRAGAGVLFVPAWDFVRDAELHARMAIMRAVEGGFALARSAQQGLVTAADHCGRVLAETRSPAVGEVFLLARISPGPARTFYSMTGDWFAWLNIALLGAAVAFLKRDRGAPS